MTVPGSIVSTSPCIYKDKTIQDVGALSLVHVVVPVPEPLSEMMTCPADGTEKSTSAKQLKKPVCKCFISSSCLNIRGQN